MGSDQDYNTQVGFPVIPNLESTCPIRKEMGENPSLGDLRPSNHEAQASTMSNAPHEASVAQVVISHHRDEFMREVYTTGASGSHAEESPTPLEKADIVRNILEDGDELSWSNQDDGSPREGIGGDPVSFFQWVWCRGLTSDTG